MAVGGVSFVSDTSLLFFLKEFLHIYYLISAAFGFILGSSLSYVLNTRLVFHKHKQHDRRKELLFFIFIDIIGLGLHELFLWIFTDGLGIYYLISKFITVFLVFIWNYLMRKFFLFRTTTLTQP